jgi:hypothetical protein
MGDPGGEVGGECVKLCLSNASLVTGRQNQDFQGLESRPGGQWLRDRSRKGV